MEGAVPVAIASASALYSTCNAMFALWSLHKSRRKDKQLTQMQQDIRNIATSVKPKDDVALSAPALPPAPSLDDQIATLFDTLKATPSAALHDSLVALINSKRVAILNGLQFDTVDDLVAKSKVVTEQIEEMLEKAAQVLKGSEQPK